MFQVYRLSGRGEIKAKRNRWDVYGGSEAVIAVKSQMELFRATKLTQS